jgi:hypothetical protein
VRKYSKINYDFKWTIDFSVEMSHLGSHSATSLREYSSRSVRAQNLDQEPAILLRFSSSEPAVKNTDLEARRIFGDRARSEEVHLRRDFMEYSTLQRRLIHIYTGLVLPRSLQSAENPSNVSACALSDALRL